MIRDLNDHPSTAVTAPATRVAVAGMTCQNCVRHVTEAIQKIAGVSRVTVRLETGLAEIHWIGGMPPDWVAIRRSVADAGFEASPLDDEDDAVARSPWSPLAGWRFNVAVGLAALVPLAAGEWIGHWVMTPWFRWLALALALPVQILCGARFYRGAWLQLKAGSSNMDTLVALGSTTAFAYSAWALLSGRPEHLYFMESVAIITLISAGHAMEAYASARASDSLKSLMELAPPMAWRRSPHGRLALVPVGDLALGDTVVLRPGDRIPTDGQVIEGGSAVDESMLTGESLPNEKTVASAVYAGTINLNRQLAVRVTATGEATALANIIGVVQRAQTSRAQIQRLGDRVSAVFVPSVVTIAILTGLGWGLAPESARRFHQYLAPWLWHAPLIQSALAAAFIHAAGVLIVACPCAMGLATPAAIMSGANAAARRGILIRDGVALEKCGRINTILFDKTGTLTEGKVTVAALQLFPTAGREPHEIEALASAMARPSRHPLSQAIAKPRDPQAASPVTDGLPIQTHTTEPPVSAGDEADLHSHPPFSPVNEPQTNADATLLDWQEVRGAGLQAATRIAGRVQSCRLGSLHWLRQNGVDSAPADPFIKAWSDQAATIIGLAVDHQLAAVFALRDSLKAAAPEVVQMLRRQGHQVYLVTGDSPQTALAIARQLGMPAENVVAEARPDQKAVFIQQLQQNGRQVAFIGDGINDAPALEQADLGVAVCHASDVAREAADIILLQSDIRAVPEALALAQATLRTIRQNLFWAFFYNAAGIPLAALGFLSPILCAAAMGLSDLVVIGNALRLLRFGKGKDRAKTRQPI